jgi:hypothetical protein
MNIFIYLEIPCVLSEVSLHILVIVIMTLLITHMVLKIEIIIQKKFSAWELSEIIRRTSIQVGQQMGINLNV